MCEWNTKLRKAVSFEIDDKLKILKMKKSACCVLVLQ